MFAACRLRGPKGKRLSDLELLTATKISIPRQEDPSDVITVTGTRDGIEKAVDEIQLISDEQVGECVLWNVWVIDVVSFAYFL